MKKFDVSKAIDRYEMVKHKFRYVTLDDDVVARIDKQANALAKFKLGEDQYKKDGLHTVRRFKTGLTGEAAMEKDFGEEIIDWSIGDSAIYNIADLTKIGINVGVKTVQLGKAHIIHKVVKRPEIICIDVDDVHVAICGLATVSVLEQNQSDHLILDDNLRAKGTKTGFYGLDVLKMFWDLRDLKNLLRWFK